MNLVAYLYEQMKFSEATFGPSDRYEGICDHIKKELEEARENPWEWVDVIILALDGAWRAGLTPEQIAFGIAQKLETNKKREWPDWRTADRDKAIEHRRDR